MTMFDDLLAVADGVLDAEAAEGFIIHPQISTPNARPLPDPDRPIIRGHGIFELRAGTAGGIQIGKRSFNRRRNDFRMISSAPAPRISIAEIELDGIAVRQGDRVDLVDRSHPQRFEVVSIQPDAHGRVMLELVAQ